VLVALDAVGLRGGRPLTYRAASLQSMLEGALVIAVLVIAIMGTQLPPSLVVWRVAPGGVGIAGFWAVGIWLLSRAGSGLPWHEAGRAPEAQKEPPGHSRKRKAEAATKRGHTTPAPRSSSPPRRSSRSPAASCSRRAAAASRTTSA